MESPLGRVAARCGASGRSERCLRVVSNHWAVSCHLWEETPTRGGMTDLLLVEDNPTLRLSLQTTLEVEGFSVHVAPDAASGIALAHRSRPRVVIVDVTLGGQQGYQLVRTLRDGDYRVPILAIATMHDHVGLLHAFQAGADDCM